MKRKILATRIKLRKSFKKFKTFFRQTLKSEEDNISLISHQKHRSNSIFGKLYYVRFMVVVSVFFLAFTTLTVRLFDLTFFYDQTQTLKKAADIHSNDSRAEFVDRNGVTLAVNLSSASLYANPKIIFDHEEVAEKLVKIFPDLNQAHLVKDLSSAKSFVYIKRNLTPKQQFEVNNLGIPGLAFERAEKRIYPHGNLLSHVLGFVGMEGKGLAGLEKYYDQELEKGHKLADNKLQLSIDVRIQNILNEELQTSIDDFSAIGGAGIILDAKTFEVLAATSLPNFDPHNPGVGNPDRLFNRFSLGLYEPGSIFKTVSIALALDSNVISLKDVYNVDAPIKYARFSIHDYKGKGGWLSIPEIFMYSSNIGTAKISLDVGKRRQVEFLKSMGLLDQLSTELPERATPFYPSEAKWSDLSTMTISFGHGYSTTLLHTTRAIAAILNGGNLKPVTFLKQDSHLGKFKNNKKVLKEKTSEQMRKLYRLVVAKGTGKRSNVEGYLVGGKTGTAEKIKKGGYNKNSRISSFIAAFPITDPKYVVLVMIDEPKGTEATGGYATAGMTAAPTAGRIISRIGPLMGIDTIDENDDDIKHKLWLDLNSSNDIDSL